MTGSLIAKEIRQHWLPFLLVAGLLAVGYFLLLGVVLIDDSGSRFESVRRFLFTMLPLGGLVVCNRLVVREYQSKTQLFIESLPVPRSRMIVVKYLLGLLILFLAVSLVFAFTLLISYRNEPITPRFFAIMGARAYTYTWCVYSFFFMMGLMGRYRVVLYLIGIIGFAAVETITRLELSRFGPFALIDDQFAFERFEFPGRALYISLGVIACTIVLIFVLALMREGSVAALLAEKMTHREKVMATVLVFTILFGVTVYDERVEKKPFDLPGAFAVERGEVVVKVSVDDERVAEKTLRLTQIVADEVVAMQEYLGLSDPPPIFMIQWSELDAYEFERGELDGAEGLLARANFDSDDWEDARFLSWLLRELLLVWSDDRLEWEPNLWVLDGFPLFWVCRDESATSCDRAKLELRAAYGASRGFLEPDTVDWLRYRERVGEDISSAVAWWGLEALQRKQGDERCREFLRRVLDCSIPADFRGTLHEWSHPISRVFENQAGITSRDFAGVWLRDLRSLAASRETDLGTIPRISGEITFAPISDYTEMVRFHFKSDPPPKSGRFAVLYSELPAFDSPVEPSEIRREDAMYADHAAGELPGTFGRGSRLYSTFAAWVDTLGCEIISGWTRREVR